MKRFSTLIAVVSILGHFGCAAKKQGEDPRLKEVLHIHQAELDSCYDKVVKSAVDQRDIGSGEMQIKRKAKDASFELLQAFNGALPVYKCIKQRMSTWNELPEIGKNHDLEISITFTKKISSGRSDQALAEEIRAHAQDFRTCYENAIARNKKTGEGVSHYRFVINSQGKVEDFYEIEGFEGSKEVAACMRNKVPHWQFASSSEPTGIEWKWTYHKKKD